MKPKTKSDATGGLEKINLHMSIQESRGLKEPSAAYKEASFFGQLSPYIHRIPSFLQQYQSCTRK